MDPRLRGDDGEGPDVFNFETGSSTKASRGVGMTRYQGSCHCGRIAFEFEGTVDGALACNCSICHARGALWFGVTDDRFRLLRGEEALGTYRFGTMTARHHFCTTCGIGPFCRPRIAPQAWAVNLRCVEGVDIAGLPVETFDGRDWEAAARSFLARRRQ